MDEYLGEAAFVPLKSDAFVYIYDANIHSDPTNSTNIRVALALYANGNLLLGLDKVLLSDLRDKMMARFRVSNLGDAKVVLGIRDTLVIDQTQYAKNIVDTFGTEGCNYMTTSGYVAELSLGLSPSDILIRLR